jgi:hypothetical protein
VTPSDASIAELAGILFGDAAASSGLAGVSPEALLEHTRERLARAARLLGLKGVGKLRKRDLAERVHRALHAIAPSGGPPDRAASPEAGGETAETGARSKFDLGRHEPGPAVEHIPWSYDQNRITAMVVDPRRMYAYWEVRDDAIEAARAALGPGTKDAALSLRVHDVTGRIFDGTNAHSSFDQPVARADRQWFFDIDKPTSTHCVEIGLRSRDGQFRRIARSGRVDFPRAEPAPAGPVEWMSVHAVTGEVASPGPGAGAAQPPASSGSGPVGQGARDAGPSAGVEGEYWAVDEAGPPHEWAILSGWERHDFLRLEWVGGDGRAERTERFEWVGPVVGSTWEAGPFPMPIELPGLVEERHEGPVVLQKIGSRTRILYGPWQVVIRGIGARAERRVLATWEVRKSWITEFGFEVVGGRLRWEARGATEAAPLAPGERARRLGGASERVWLAGSEVRLAGASEVFRVGASEIRLRGASEVLAVGASEARYRGASEARRLGASEVSVERASEQRLLGASERAARRGST